MKNRSFLAMLVSVLLFSAVVASANSHKDINATDEYWNTTHLDCSNLCGGPCVPPPDHGSF